MQPVRRFLDLSTEERVLLVRAIVALMLVRLALPFVSLERLERWARPARGAERSLAAIVWAVRTAARRLPGTTCLPAALVLQRMLCGAGHRSELHVGVARAGNGLAAHAWVARDGEVLIGDRTPTVYTSLLRWP
jgi:hypothetical protein